MAIPATCPWCWPAPSAASLTWPTRRSRIGQQARLDPRFGRPARPHRIPDPDFISMVATENIHRAEFIAKSKP
jgi:hypothetical protein